MSNTTSRIDPVTMLRRLRRALIVIRSIPQESFAMNQWMTPLEWSDIDALYRADTSQKKAALSKKVGECGTIGCALGWCGRDPVLRQEGLECSVLGDFRVHHRSVRGTYSHNSCEMRTSGEIAAETFFGITADEAYRLFMPDSYPDNRQITPKQVAARLQRVIDRYETATLV